MSDLETDGSHRERGSKADLRAELQSRIAEAEWLKAHYDEQLRAAFAQIAALQARIRAPAPPADPSRAPVSEADAAEISRLRREVERLSAAEICYLDRIEELKEQLHGR